MTRLTITALVAFTALPSPLLAQSTEAAVSAISDSPAPPPAATAPAPATPAPQAASAVAEGPIPAPPAGKGQVVFFRSGTIIGTAISCAVHENGAKLSSLSRGRYVVIPADPGIHSYMVQSEARDVLRLEIEPGETYYAQCSISMGFMVGRPYLSPSDRNAFSAMASKLTPVDKK